MITICFIINNLKLGGAERQFVELIKGIDKKKFNVTIYLYAENEPMFYDNVLDIDGINILREPLHSSLKLGKLLKAAFKIRQFIITNNFNLIYTTLVMNGALVRFAAFGLSQYRNRIVSSFRNNFSKCPLHQKIIEAVLITNSYFVANNNDSSEAFKTFLRGKFCSKIYYIYNGVDKNRFTKKTYQKNKPKVIGSVGRMSKPKNQIQILRALKLLDLDLTLYIIGDDGILKKSMEEYITNHLRKKNINIISRVSDVENYYTILDIFILPSLFEGCPNALFEAMLSGCMCIVSKNANTDNFIKNRLNGFVYDNTDFGLACCIKEACQIYATDEGKRIIENGYNYAKRTVSLDNMIKEYDRLFTSLLYKRT